VCECYARSFKRSISVVKSHLYHNKFWIFTGQKDIFMSIYSHCFESKTCVGACAGGRKIDFRKVQWCFFQRIMDGENFKTSMTFRH